MPKKTKTKRQPRKRVITRSQTKKKSTRRKKAEKFDCDSIAWLVDLLGTDEILRSAAAKTGDLVDKKDDNFVNISEETHHGSLYRTDKPTGLYYYGGHWYYYDMENRARKDRLAGREPRYVNNVNKGVYDAYKEDYQLDQTAHFCQTFALLIYRMMSYGDDFGLKRGEYAKNIEIAMQFWIDFLTENDNVFTEPVMTNIKTYRSSDKHEEVYIPIFKKNVSKITKTEFIKFLKYVKKNADSLTGCRQ